MPRNPSSIRPEPETVSAVVRPRQKANAEASTQAIRQRAYEIYLARGAQPGREAEDWAQAERELRAATRPVAAR